MFVQYIKLVEVNSGKKKNFYLCKKYTNITFKLAKMDLVIRGISANLGEMVVNTFINIE